MAGYCIVKPTGPEAIGQVRERDSFIFEVVDYTALQRKLPARVKQGKPLKTCVKVEKLFVNASIVRQTSSGSGRLK